MKDKKNKQYPDGADIIDLEDYFVEDEISVADEERYEDEDEAYLKAIENQEYDEDEIIEDTFDLISGYKKVA